MTTKPVTLLALVQVLALDDPAKQEAALLALCEGWGVEPVYLGKPLFYPRWLNVIVTVERLAKHALEYSRKQADEMT